MKVSNLRRTFLLQRIVSFYSCIYLQNKERGNDDDEVRVKPELAPEISQSVIEPYLNSNVF